MPPSLSEAAFVENGTILAVRFSDGATVRLPLKALRDSTQLLEDPSDPPRARIIQAAVSRSGDSVRLDHGDGFTQDLEGADLADLAGLIPIDDPDRPADLLVENAAWLVTCAGPADSAATRLGLVEDGEVVVRAGRVMAAGPRDEVHKQVPVARNARRIDARGRGVSPGLIDPHTHPVFGGQRAREFAMRAAGATYLEIAEAGGGIRSTVTATRSATDADLKLGTRGRLRRLLNWGVTSIEAKSGYSLDVQGELRMLRILRELDPVQPVDITRTLLAAHVVPAEYKDDRETYIRQVIEEIIPAAATQGLAHGCDVFCESGAYTLDESRGILSAAKAHGLALRIHAEQFTDTGAAALAAELGALSADHLEAAGDATIEAMAGSDTVAVLLPGAALTVGDRFPDARRLLDRGVKVALGTDLNPGTSMTESLPLMMSLACTQMGMTCPEAWLAVTTNAATAIGRNDVGRLAPGCLADFVIYDAPDPAYIPYHLAGNTILSVYKYGRPAVETQGGL